jgi:DNA polymerase
MPNDLVDPEAVPTPDQMAAALMDLTADLRQVLGYQKGLGITHVAVGEKTQKILKAWGTPAWQQHRFIFQGPPNAKIMIVDSKGGFFQGSSGQLLVKILKAMKLTPETVFICNAADPHPIQERIKASPPKAIIALGARAKKMLEPDDGAEGVPGRFHVFCGVKVMPTRHPEALLADPSLKRGVWESMQQVMAMAGLGNDC